MSIRYLLYLEGGRFHIGKPKITCSSLVRNIVAWTPMSFLCLCLTLSLLTWSLLRNKSWVFFFIKIFRIWARSGAPEDIHIVLAELEPTELNVMNSSQSCKQDQNSSHLQPVISVALSLTAASHPLNQREGKYNTCSFSSMASVKWRCLNEVLREDLMGKLC